MQYNSSINKKQKFEGKTYLSSRVCQGYNDAYICKIINSTAFDKQEIFKRATIDM